MHLSISIGWILHITENENRNYVNACPLYHKLGPVTYYIKIKILFLFKKKIQPLFVLFASSLLSF